MNKLKNKREPLFSCPNCGSTLTRGKGSHTKNRTDTEKLTESYVACVECGMIGKAIVHIKILPKDIHA